jgi:hypothetical protein
MPESSIVVRPQPMNSASYTASSRLQAAGLRPAMAIFEEAAAVVPLPRAPQPIVIADYGAATGHNSLLPICAAIDVLRKRTRPEHSILVIHTDVPEAVRRSGHLPGEGSGDVRVGDRPVLL